LPLLEPEHRTRHTPISQEHAAPTSDRSNHCRRSRDRQSRIAIQDVSDAELARCRAEIAKLLPLWPRELADMSPAGRAHVVATLKRALRAERRRGLAGHWTYNLARHRQLLQAYRAEMAAAQARLEPAKRHAQEEETEKF
jgi:hypothetical protein